MKKEKPITRKQQNALYKYFDIVAESLNNAGFDIHAKLPPIDISWNKITVKEILWRATQKIELGKESTKDLTTGEVDKVFNTLNRYLAENFGISEPFPSIEEIMVKQRMAEFNK